MYNGEHVEQTYNGPAGKLILELWMPQDQVDAFTRGKSKLIVEWHKDGKLVCMPVSMNAGEKYLERMAYLQSIYNENELPPQGYYAVIKE